MKFFTFPDFRYMLKDLAAESIKVENFVIDRYPNKELDCQVKTEVNEQDCAIIATVSPPESNLLELTLLAHTLKTNGAKSVTAVLPYLAYSRQDKPEPGKSLGIDWIGSLLAGSGVDQIITVDIHSEQDKKYLKFPVKSISPAKLFVSKVVELKEPGWVVLAPDKGAINRAEDFAKAAKIKSPVAYLEKVRRVGVFHQKLVGKMTDKVIIVDDISATGSTLISAVQELKKVGAKEIVIVVSHGEFIGQKWRALESQEVKKIYCLDTIPSVTKYADGFISIIPSGGLIYDQLTTLG